MFSVSACSAKNPISYKDTKLWYNYLYSFFLGTKFVEKVLHV